MAELKYTPLAEWHKEKGAKMVPFAGYLMPVNYPLGVLKEHLHTRDAAGLFDVSHMGQIQILGDEDLPQLLEEIFPANLIELPVDRQCYSFLLNDEGGVIDDLMICRREYDFLLVVNAGCKLGDLARLQKLLEGRAEVNLIDDRALLALQGPKAAAVLTALGANVESMRFMDGAWIEIRGIECWATRSGYTGEDGFELSVAADKSVQLASLLCENPDVQPIGLGARDSLRLEAGLCLYGHELDTLTTPIEASLNWAIAKARRSDGYRPGGFMGAEVILLQMAEGCDKRRIGLVAEGKAPVREHTRLFTADGREVGVVTSGGFGPSLGKPVAIAYVDSDSLAEERLFADVRDKRLPMLVSPMPFVPNRYCR